MKSIKVNFRIGGYCSMYLDVPDDYQIKTTDPLDFWRDIKEKVGSKIAVDPLVLDDATFEVSSDADIIFEEMVFDYFTWVSLFDENGEEEYNVNLDHIPSGR